MIAAKMVFARFEGAKPKFWVPHGYMPSPSCLLQKEGYEEFLAFPMMMLRIGII